MKKLLSIFLTLALLISCVATIPSLTTSAADTAATSVPSADYDTYTEILNSSNYTSQKNSAIDSTDNSGLWFAQGWAGGNSTRMFTKSGQSSGKLLARNLANNTNVGDFEWQFEFVAQKYQPSNTSAKFYNEPAYAKVAFCFHVNENSNISSFAKLNNVLNVTLYGDAFTHGTAHDQVDNALVINYPRTDDGAMRPLGYDNIDITPDDENPATTRIPNLSKNGYLKLDDASNTSEVDISSPTTINIKLTGNVITVTVWNTSNEETTKRSTTAELYTDALELAPSGDFAIVNGGTVIDVDDSTLDYANSSNFGVFNMSIKRTAKLFDSNYYTTVDINTAGWLKHYNTSGNGTVGFTYDSDSKEMTVGAFTTSNPILENLGISEKLDDFAWEFDYYTADSSYMYSSFNFHVDTFAEGKYQSSLGTVSNRANGYRRSMMGVAFTGSATNYYEAADVVQNAAIIQATRDGDTADKATVKAAGYSMVNYETTVDSTTKELKTGTYRYPTSYTDMGSWKTETWYTVRIVMKDNYVWTYIWETDNMAGTLKTVVYCMNDTQMDYSPNGDFAIISENRGFKLRNMRIYDSAEVFKSAEDYSEYTSAITETAITFDEGTEHGLTFGAGTEVVEGALVTSRKDTISNWDNGNNNLKDFVVKFNYKLNLNGTTGNADNWHADFLAFRVTNSSYYKVAMYKKGNTTSNPSDQAANTNNEYLKNYDYMTLEKVEGDTTTELARAALSRLTYKSDGTTAYTIKIEAIGNTINAYLSDGDYVSVQPVLSVTDSSFNSGSMYFRKTTGSATIDDIYIYDITANDVAKQVNSKIEPLNRGDYEKVDTAKALIDSMSDAQKVKLAVQSANITASYTMLDNLEKAGHDVNASGEVDIRDIVAMRNHLADNTAITNESADPIYDSVLDKNDIVKLRYWVLGLEWSDTAIQ